MARPTHFIPQSIGYVIDALRKAKNRNERLQILKDHDNIALRCILRMQFDDELIFELPKDEVEFKPGNFPLDLGDTSLKQQYKKFYLFLKDKHPRLKQDKREKIFIRLLESLDDREAKILLDVKDKKLKCGVTKKLVDEAFPGLLPEKEEKVVEKKEKKKKEKVEEVPEAETVVVADVAEELELEE
jgi:hypothetical protein